MLRAPAPFTWDELWKMPDDGYRRELVHGQLLVTPSPTAGHQNAVPQLCRPGLRSDAALSRRRRADGAHPVTARWDRGPA